MALVFNNVTVPQSGNVIYNGTSLSASQTRGQRRYGSGKKRFTPAHRLQTHGDLGCGPDFTGGWDARAADILK